MTQTGWKDIPHHRTLCLIYKLREVGQERPFSSQGQAEHQSAGGEQWYWASLFSFCYLPFHHNCYCFYFYGYCYFFFFSTVQLFLAQLTGFIFFLILIPIPMGEGRGEGIGEGRSEQTAVCWLVGGCGYTKTPVRPRLKSILQLTRTLPFWLNKQWHSSVILGPLYYNKHSALSEWCKNYCWQRLFCMNICKYLSW